VDRITTSDELYPWSEQPKAFPVPGKLGLLGAERLTRGKAAIEIPVAVRAGLGSLANGHSIAEQVEFGNLYVRRLDEARLDDSSRALVKKLQPMDWAREVSPLDDAALASEVAILEAIVAADTERNERFLHGEVHRWYTQSLDIPSREALNARVYRELFLTPADDPWLGFSTPLVFTGLPRDGIVK
jgi:hypothetical protein